MFGRNVVLTRERSITIHVNMIHNYSLYEKNVILLGVFNCKIMSELFCQFMENKNMLINLIELNVIEKKIILYNTK